MSDIERRQQQLISQAYATMATAIQVMRHSHELALQSARVAQELLNRLDNPPIGHTIPGVPPPDHK